MKYCSSCQKKHKHPVGRNCKRAITSSDSDSDIPPGQSHLKKQPSTGTSSSGQQSTNMTATSTSQTVPQTPPSQATHTSQANFMGSTQTSQSNFMGTHQGAFAHPGSSQTQYYHQDQTWPPSNQWGTQTHNTQLRQCPA